MTTYMALRASLVPETSTLTCMLESWNAVHRHLRHPFPPPLCWVFQPPIWSQSGNHIPFCISFSAFIPPQLLNDLLSLVGMKKLIVVCSNTAVPHNATSQKSKLLAVRDLISHVQIMCAFNSFLLSDIFLFPSSICSNLDANMRRTSCDAWFSFTTASHREIT